MKSNTKTAIGASMLTANTLCLVYAATAVLILSGWFWTTSAEEFSGTAKVIDGDTIKLGDTRIRLQGLDAPEASQLCYSNNATAWPCGKAATEALTTLLSQHPVRCQSTLRDPYRRYLGTCMVGITSVNAWLVRQGWAVAYRKYSNDYISQENSARGAKLGIWSGSFIMPWQWRHGQRFKMEKRGRL